MAGIQQLGHALGDGQVHQHNVLIRCPQKIQIDRLDLLDATLRKSVTNISACTGILIIIIFKQQFHSLHENKEAA